jgi:hypothetical protein
LFELSYLIRSHLEICVVHESLFIKKKKTIFT